MTICVRCGGRTLTLPLDEKIFLGLTPSNWVARKRGSARAALHWGLYQGIGGEESFYAGEEFAQAVGLGDDSGYAKGGGEGPSEDVVEHSVNDHGSSGHSGPEQGRDFDTVHDGHGKIEENQVWAEGDRFVQGFHAIDSFTANLELRLVLEERTNGMPDGNFVFDDKDAFGHGRTEKKVARRFVEESRVNPVNGLQVYSRGDTGRFSSELQGTKPEEPSAGLPEAW
jgi:hypothetical protein